MTGSTKQKLRVEYKVAIAFVAVAFATVPLNIALVFFVYDTATISPTTEAVSRLEMLETIGAITNWVVLASLCFALVAGLLGLYRTTHRSKDS